MIAGKVYGEQFAVVPDRVLYADISANAKVLWALYQRSSARDGRIYPGRKLMGKLMGCSMDTISRAKRELIEAHLIEVRERYDEHGRRTTDDVFLAQGYSANLQGALGKSAEYVLRTSAETDPDYKEPEPPLPPRLGTSRPPTDTRPLPIDGWRRPLDPDQRSAALARVRDIRGGKRIEAEG